MSNRFSILEIADARYDEMRQLLLRETQINDLALIRQQDAAQQQNLLLLAGSSQLAPAALHARLKQEFGDAAPAQLIHVSALPRGEDGRLNLSALEAMLRQPVPDNVSLDVMLTTQAAGVVAAVPDTRPAQLDGATLPPDPLQRNNLGDALRAAAASANSIHFIGADGERATLTYRQLLEQAGCIASALLASGAPGAQTLVLQTRSLQATVVATWAGWLAGIPVAPLPLSESATLNDGNGIKLLSVLNSLSGLVILCEEMDRARLQDALAVHQHAVTVHSLSTLRQATLPFALPQVPAECVALYLLTSGSTVEPKLVPQTHGRILHRSRASQQVNDFTTEDISLNWMPLDHVGGIVMFHAQDVVSGCTQIQVQTSYVLQDPLRWLDLCSQYRVSLTWAPNFAYGLVNAKAQHMAGREWHLNSLRFILNGGEAISASQAHQFLQHLAAFGLPASAMVPSWGMSETCSGVVFNQNFLATPANAPHTSTGLPVPGISLRVVDAQGRLKNYGEEGHLQIKGASVFDGYWGQEAGAMPAFSEDGWFNTGDLALIGEAGISIVGRDKELVIVNGRNIAFHEIEARISQIPGVEPGTTCVFIERQPQEQLCLVISSQLQGDVLNALVAQIRSELRKTFALTLDRLYCLMPEQINKTSIGKIQRRKVQQTIQTMALPALWVNRATAPQTDFSAHCFVRQWRALPGIRRHQTVRKVALYCGDSSTRDTLSSLLAGHGIDVLPFAADDATQLTWRTALSDILSPLNGVTHLLFIAQTQKQAALKQRVHTLLAPLCGLLREWQNAACSLPLTVLTLNGAKTEPLDSMVSSLVRAARLEMPRFQGSVVQLDGLRADTLGGLLAELDTVPRDSEVAWRAGQRFVSRLSRLPASEFAAARDLRHKTVIAGGLGGAGFIMSQYLAQQSDAPIWLLGRTPAEQLPGASLMRLARLRELSAQIHYKSVDVTDYPALSQALVQIQNEAGGPIGSLYNLVGDFRNSTISALDPQRDFALLDSKVLGSSHLYSLAKELSIPSLVLFSSANGYLSGAGVALYAAANRYQEALAQLASEEGKVKVSSLGWSMLKDTGLSQGAANQELTQAKGYLLLQAEQAIPALFQTRSEAACVIGLNPQAPALWPQFWFTPARMPATRAQAAPAPERSADTDTQDGIAQALIAIWQDLLDIDNLDWDENLFDLGATSLLLPQVKLQMEQCFGVSLELVDLFQYPSVATMAQFIAGRSTPVAVHAIEHRLTQFWQDILDLEDFSPEENVFDIGANSLLLPQLQQFIATHFDLKLSLVDLFQYPSVATLAAHIGSRQKAR